MLFTTSAIALSLLAATVSASPTPAAVEEKRTFSVKQKSVGKRLKVPAEEVLKVYAKYGKTAPAAVKTAAAVAAAATQTGSVVATPEAYDEAYLAPVTIGGSQTFNLDFDTGSADLWVFSNLLPKADDAGHDIYTTNSSKLKSGYTWDIVYGDGSSAAGLVYADTVNVGGATATSQAVEAATSVSSTFISDSGTDGLLGLAFSSINTVSPTAQTTFFDTVKSTLAEKLFTSNLKHSAAGTYDFGYIDKSKYSGSISYVTVNSGNGFWEFTAGNYTVKSTRFTGTIGTSIADTGTTLLYLPTKVCTNYYGQIKKSTYSETYGGWVFPCSATPPNFEVNLGGTYFTVPGSYLNYSPVTSTMCYGSIQPNTGIGFSIFGDIFLKSAFVVWDQTQSTPRLGFAAQA